MERVSSKREIYSRRVLVVSILLGVFVLFDLALFGWLIFQSLSRREVERLLTETRAEAESLAERIAGEAEGRGRDLYTAVASERETQTYIDSVLAQREIVRTVEIRDKEGRLVFRGLREGTFPGQEGGALPGLESQELSPTVEERTVEHESSYDLTIPIADLGNLYIGISPGEMASRVETLREDLIRQAAVLGAVTLAVVILASLVIWWLLRRGRILEEQAIEAERLAYIGTLASGLAHEIRNPLNSLNLNMQMLEEEARVGLGDGSSRRLLTITRSEISRLERLVTDFLAYARPRPLEREPMTAGELLDRVVDVLAGQIQQHGVEVSVEDDTAGASASVDPGQVSQVLLNLAQNALAATEGSNRAPQLRLRAWVQEEWLVLAVADNGIGIPDADRERVFDIFFSTRKGGTGLGLAIARRIAQSHDGRIEIVAPEGGGTEVRLYLPRAGSERAPSTRRPVAS